MSGRGAAILPAGLFAPEERKTSALLRRSAGRRCDPVSVLPAGGLALFLPASREGRETSLLVEVFMSTINRGDLPADGATYNPPRPTRVSIRVPAAARSFRGRHRHLFFRAEAPTRGHTSRNPDGKNSPRTATSPDTGCAERITKRRAKYSAILHGGIKNVWPQVSVPTKVRLRVDMFPAQEPGGPGRAMWRAGLYAAGSPLAAAIALSSDS